MQQLNFVNDVFTISYWNEGYSLKSWCERVIKVKRGRLSYEDISSLDFVMEMENQTVEEVVLNEQRIEDIIDAYYYENVYGKEQSRVAEIAVGLPCSGKSTYLRKQKCVICDSDLVKELMPEYENGRGNERCHKASKIIFKELLNRLAKDGYKLGIPIIGKSEKSFNEIYDVLIENGYQIKVRYNKISKLESLNRALVRFIEEDRFVSLNYINGINENDIDDVYSKVIHYTNVIDSEVEVFDYKYNQSFAVKAKCGHVGANYYVVKEFLVYASSKKEAAEFARNLPRVKHDHKDAIIDVRVVDFNEGRTLWIQNETDPYLHCKNRREQDACQLDLELIEESNDTYKKVYDKNKKKKINHSKEKRCKDEIRRFKQIREYEME